MLTKCNDKCKYILITCTGTNNLKSNPQKTQCRNNPNLLMNTYQDSAGACP